MRFKVDSMSYKNQLQEFAQSNKHALPEYETISTAEGFTSKVTVGSKLYFNHKHDVAKTKKDAEQKAAKLALKILGFNPEECKAGNLTKSESCIPKNHDIKKLVYVDADNIDISANIIRESPNVAFVLFLSRNASKNVEQQSMLSNCFMKTAPVIGKDACDVLMCYEARASRDIAPDMPFAIVTKDHFGQSLASISGGEHICSLSELAAFLCG